MDKFNFKKTTVTNNDNQKNYSFSTIPVDDNQLRTISLTEFGKYALSPLDNMLTGSNDERDKYAVRINEPVLGVIIVVWKYDGSDGFTLHVNPDEGDASIYSDYSEGCVLYLVKEN